MGVVIRAVVYSTMFIGMLLIFLPAQLLISTGIQQPAAIGPLQVGAVLLGALGAALALACILTFALVGKGTPAPFDPPRRLVVAGPYRHIRNPMYVGAGLTLLAATIYYRSVALLAYLLGFMLVMNAFVHWFEEPTLRRMFGADYDAYRAATPRWLPRWNRSGAS